MKNKIIVGIKTAVYWCSLVAPIYDVLKATVTAVKNIIIAEHDARQKMQFEQDSKFTDYDSPIYVSLKQSVNVKGEDDGDTI